MNARVLWLAAAVPVALAAQTLPDFSGVYYPINPFGNFRGGPAAGAAPKGPPPRPTASAPLADGSTGRRPDEPSLTPEYMAKWKEISKSLVAGKPDYDLTAKCLPPGMPAVMSMFYGMEVMQNKDKITFFSELNDATRRVYLDGRKPSQKVLDDPTYAGYSTGHWEGDTLVVDTVAIRGDTFIESITPHSDEMTVHERIRFKEPGLLEDRLTVTDPKALTKPWETVKTYRRAKPGSGQDELREFACAEGIADAK
jgi:hypothetical protein